MKNDTSLSRRNFLKTAATGLGGYVLLSPNQTDTLAQTDTLTQTEEKKQKFVYRTLGKTGIKLPVISMGVMNSDNPNLVKAALDSGIVHLDTAWYYQRGRNEKMIGSVIKDYPRDSYVIATKIYDQARDPKTHLFTENATEEGFLRKFNQSIERLGIDYVDILYMHSTYFREMVLYKPFLHAMEKLKKDGRARFVGVSTHYNEPEVIQAAIDSQFYDVVLTAYNFKQDYLEKLQDVIQKAAEAGLGIIGMKTLGGGYLDEEKTKPVDPKAAIRFTLKNKNIHTIIPGFTTFEQMETDLAVMNDLDFTEKDSEMLELGYNSNYGIYCQGCRTCIQQCPKHLPIPEMMRAHMYAYSYHNYWEAKEVVNNFNIPSSVCDNCESCSVKCKKAFDIKRKVSEVASLKSVPERLFT